MEDSVHSVHVSFTIFFLELDTSSSPHDSSYFSSPNGPSQSLAAAVQCWFLYLPPNSMEHMWQRCPYLWHCYQTLRRHERIGPVTPGMLTLFNRNSPSIQSNHVRPWQNHCLLLLHSFQGPAITDMSDVIKRPTEGLCEPDSRRWMIAFIKWTSDVSTFPSIKTDPDWTPQHIYLEVGPASKRLRLLTS